MITIENQTKTSMFSWIEGYIRLDTFNVSIKITNNSPFEENRDHNY